MFQAFALAAVTLTDRRPTPTLPRWFGYFQIWDALLFAPAGLIMFFHTGPLAWNGVIAFWIAIIAAAAWLLVTTTKPDDDTDLGARVRQLEKKPASLTNPTASAS